MLNRSDVIAAFSAILHRSPESDAVIEGLRHFEKIEDLCDVLVRCPEFVALLTARFGRRQEFSMGELDNAVRDFQTNNGASWAGKSLALPDWLDTDLDPDSVGYRNQMLRLWGDITGRASYDAFVDEATPEIADLDAIYRPAFYASGDTHFSGGHIMAMGHIIMRSGIRVDGRVLEYGAGYGQTALSLARIGAQVDTVDINPAFCSAVQANAELFKANLRSYVGEFGFNPAGRDHAYDLILFYESFHHCLDFQTLIPKLRKLLAPTGKVILAGEPIFAETCAALPYPWGFRIDWETLAVMRIRGWMELGFQQDYLLKKFADAGFGCSIHTDPNSHWAHIYEFYQI